MTRKSFVLTMTALVLLAAAMIGAIVLTQTGTLGPSDTLAAANTACDDPGDLDDDDQTLIIDTIGDKYYATEGPKYDDALCILDELDTPRAVLEQITATRSLDGRQEADWDDIEASWTYHPDDGLDLILTIAD